MTIEELADFNGIEVATVKKRLGQIPGVELIDGEYVIPDGSRYPYDAHRYKFNDIDKRRRALLDAISKFKYVDSKTLKMTEESFVVMLEELEKAGYIMNNGSSNEYGANKYDTTLLYAQDVELNPKKFMDRIANKISGMAGHFVGGVISENS